jgi:hypothetical protein
MPTEAEDQFGEFCAFDEIAPLLGYMHRQYGEDHLRELLKQYAASLKAERETLEVAASELREAGLTRPAEIVLEAAADLPSGIDLNPHGEDDAYNWWSWRKRWVLQRQRITGEDRASLFRRYGLDKRKC